MATVGILLIRKVLVAAGHSTQRDLSSRLHGEDEEVTGLNAVSECPHLARVAGNLAGRVRSERLGDDLFDLCPSRER